MDYAELLRWIREYNSDEDIEDTSRNHAGGNDGIYLANLIFLKSSGLEDSKKWSMMARLSALEEEALLRQNN